MHVQWAWLLSSYFGPRAMANFPVYVPSGLCVQANVDKACVGHEGVEKACVGCGGSLRTCGITFEMTFTFRSAAKVMSTWQHASLVRLQPHYVYILGSSKGAVTTALHAHSTRKRLVGVKKDRFTPTPCHPALPRCIFKRPRLQPRVCHFLFVRCAMWVH